MVDPTTVKIKVFPINGEDHPIRFYGTNETPLFRATDVGRALGLKNIHESIKHMKINQDHFTCDGSTFMTELGLDRMLLKSRRPIAETMHAWIKDTLKEIRLAAKDAFERDLEAARRHADESHGEAMAAKRETDILRGELAESHSQSVMYVYNTDIRSSDSIKKLGITDNWTKREKPYRQTHPFGRMEFSLRLPKVNIRTAEAFLFAALKGAGYHAAGENYDISSAAARGYLVLTKLMLGDFAEIQDRDERDRKMNILIANVEHVMRGAPQREGECLQVVSWTQTDPSDFLIGACQDLNQPPARTSLEKTEPEPFRFDEFLRECCDTSDPDAETSSKDLEGCYRLWRRSTSKVAFLALLDMLRTRFRPVRIKVQPHGVADSVVNGFRGIAIRHARDAKDPLPMAASDVEVFLHQMCEYAYAGKALLSDLRAEYGMWRRRVHGSCDDNDVKRMLEFVRADARVLPAVINVYEGGCGQGVYGLSILSDDRALRHRKPSTTAKGVAKIDVATGRELDRWPSIAKAASDEGLAPSRLGRGIRDKSRFNGFVYEFR